MRIHKHQQQIAGKFGTKENSIYAAMKNANPKSNLMQTLTRNIIAISLYHSKINYQVTKTK